MEAIVTTPGLMAVFSGHDHGDTWCYRWVKRLPGMTVEGNGVSESPDHVFNNTYLTRNPDLCFGQYVRSR